MPKLAESYLYSLKIQEGRQTQNWLTSSDLKLLNIRTNLQHTIIEVEEEEEEEQQQQEQEEEEEYCFSAQFKNIHTHQHMHKMYLKL